MWSILTDMKLSLMFHVWIQNFDIVDKTCSLGCCFLFFYRTCSLLQVVVHQSVDWFVVEGDFDWGAWGVVSVQLRLYNKPIMTNWVDYQQSISQLAQSTLQRKIHGLYMRPYCLKWVTLILSHDTECNDFRSVGQKYLFFGFHQNRVLQALFCSKILLLMVKCDVLWQFQAF